MSLVEHLLFVSYGYFYSHFYIFIVIFLSFIIVPELDILILFSIL
jgi:hypothetical protein